MKKLMTALFIALFVLLSFANRGRVNILIVVGGGSAELDLYVYVGTAREVSDGRGDDENVCPMEIARGGYMTVKAVNRGAAASSCRLIIK